MIVSAVDVTEAAADKHAVEGADEAIAAAGAFGSGPAGSSAEMVVRAFAAAGEE